MSDGRQRPDEQEYELVDPTPTRKAIAAHTLKSVRKKPHFWMSTEVDARPLKRIRKAVKDEEGEMAPTYNDYILKTAGLTLEENPRFNVWVSGDGLKFLERINVALAVDTDDGVMLPTVMDINEMGILAVARTTRELIELARSGNLRASLQQGAGFTVSNMGPTPIDAFSAIISPPQTGILTIGAIKPRPVVDENGEVVARDTFIATLVVDHTGADGADGTKFLTDLKQQIESEEFLEQL